MGFVVRRFHPGDAEQVKEIYTLSMSEHVHSTFLHVLKQPPVQLLLVTVFCVLLSTSGSLLLPTLALVLILASLRQLLCHVFNRYIQLCLEKDLDHVEETYMQKRDSCFWVAESEGCPVATVACLPSQTWDGCVELKRMAVQRSHRGQGVAKALCGIVATFAKEQGFRAVHLHTTVVQREAQKLYESLGYCRVGECVVPKPMAKLLNFTLIQYRYDL